MQRRKNSQTERAGVNATRTFFESQGYVFQEVDMANDYGKDAYVDLADGDTVTGLCFAVQIKSGKSFRRESGYAIPVGRHERIWRESTLPIIGLVHDPETGCLYWCNVTRYLLENANAPISTIPVPSESVLTSSTLEVLCKEVKDTARKLGLGARLLNLCSTSADQQISTLLDCFALGRKDARVLILLRYLLRLLRDEPLRVALHLLAHITPHPDIFWSDRNMIPPEVCKQVSCHLRWERDEVIWLLAQLEPEEWERGDAGEDLYMLFKEDPSIHVTMQQVLYDCFRTLTPPNKKAGWWALYLTIYWSPGHAKEMYETIVKELPEVRSLPLAPELEHILSESEAVPLF